MNRRYRELVLPSPAIVGFGLVAGLVLGVATWYATDLVTGIAAGTFIIGLTLIYLLNQSHWIKVNQQLEVGRYRLPLDLIGALSIIDHMQFRTSLKATDLVLGTNTAKKYLRIEITDPRDPYRVWLIATRNPQELIQALTKDRNLDNTSDR
ncbi:MAG: DUF3093 family protein [Candidatus Nanopelagicales bacterium]